MNNTLKKSLPFPYFCLDYDYTVIESSINFSGPITSLLCSTSLNDLHIFLSISELVESKVFHIKLDGGNFAPYEIYKAHEDQLIHLYCYPIKIHKNDEKDMHIKELENKLEQISLSNEKTERRFAAEIAHEVRNPLTTVKGFIQLSKPYLAKMNKEQYADIVLDEIDRVDQYLSEILDSSKPYKSNRRINSLNKLVQEVSLLFKGEAIINNVSLKTVLTNKNPFILVDEKQLKQVLINIVKNGIESFQQNSPKQGQIVLRTVAERNNAIIYIIDNGCGIAKENIQQLFNPYFTTKSSSTGLGLSICKNIMDDNGGIINIESQVGKGSIFKVEIPVTQEQILYA